MTNILTCVFLVFLSCGLAFGARPKLFSLDSQHEKSTFTRTDDADDGICKKRVAIYGYTCEEHTVTTPDGYILSVQRIPTGISGAAASRPPVLLQHGLIMDGITWLLNAPDESLAFILADNGFDVWITNTRGTRYSLGHTSLSPDDSAYWDWSWDELVANEFPATLQYVHDQTGQNLHYVGHSLGTLIPLAFFAQGKQPDMLISAALLSPIAYLGQVSSPLAKAAADSFLAEDLYWLGVNEFDPKGKAVQKLLNTICKVPGVDCLDLMTSFTGKNCCLNSSNSEVFLANEPQSTSTKNMVHLAQMIRGDTIAMYDYEDSDDNMKHYGQTTPPVYNMTNIPNSIPLFLSYGGEDAVSDANDVQNLLGILKDHVRDKILVQYQYNYAHADFVMGVNANQIVYDPLMAFLNSQ
ncbi:Triacylglycerol lipase [Thalictrum thalictroides]|uniref:Lipase n=1 Tax=Thalictrum thalictroides TaxID=46969 RepID=A0A7J6WXX6_THATH|nr:Triacylglycerol lipase [Thalictrum thalictroides]